MTEKHERVASKRTIPTTDVERGRKRSGFLRRQVERRKVTPEKVLASIERLEEEPTSKPIPLSETVYAWPAHRGRVTGYFVGCEQHGPMPVLAPTRDAARGAAWRHLRDEHDGRGRLVWKQAPKTKAKR